jgi:pyruvate, water dikinase
VVEGEVPDDLRDIPSISDEEIAELIAIARRVEAHYGCPQDIEWAVDRAAPPGESILLLQSRPETVWAGKDAAALEQRVAAPAARAFDHVLNALGGKPRPEA